MGRLGMSRNEANRLARNRISGELTFARAAVPIISAAIAFNEMSRQMADLARALDEIR